MHQAEQRKMAKRDDVMGLRILKNDFWVITKKSPNSEHRLPLFLGLTQTYTRRPDDERESGEWGVAACPCCVSDTRVAGKPTHSLQRAPLLFTSFIENKVARLAQRIESEKYIFRKTKFVRTASQPRNSARLANVPIRP